MTANTADTAPGGIFNVDAMVSLNGAKVAANTPTNCAGSPAPVPAAPTEAGG